MPTTTIPLDGPVNLDCRLPAATVTVNARDDLAEATVTISSPGLGDDVADRVVVARRGPTIYVASAKAKGTVFDLPMLARFREGETILVDAEVPSGTAMALRTVHGDITVSGRAGSVDVATGASRITLDQVDGDLRVRSGSGSTTVERVTGDVVIRAGSGTVRLGEAGGSLEMGCGSGDLTVGHARGKVRLRTGSGDAQIGLAEADVQLVSGSGEFTIGLRKGQAAHLDLILGHGRLRSDLPVQDDEPTERAAELKPISIRARSGSGDVRLTRAAG